MTTIQFKNDYEKKMQLYHDAVRYHISLSELMRRMVDIYLFDPVVREKVLNFNPDTYWRGEF